MTEPTELTDDEFEALAAEMHVVYCEEWSRQHDGQPYRTGGDYSKLDEPTKNYDRNLVRWYLDKTADLREQLAEAQHPAETLLGNVLCVTPEELTHDQQIKAMGEQLAQAEADVASVTLLAEEIQQRAEAAEADCTALREALAAASETLSSMDDRWAVARRALANPSPGAGLLAELEQARKRIGELEAQKDGAYQERDRLVAALSKLFPATLARHEGADWEDEWRNIVFIDLPTGQASWHIHDSELPQFAHLSQSNPKWDGHTTEEKYARLAALGEKP